MAKFAMELPTEEIEKAEKLSRNTDKIFGEMTRAGAKVVADNMKSTAPNQGLAEGIKLSRTYKTPSDDGINTKVYFSGYFPFQGNRTTFARRNRNGGKMYTTSKGVPKEFVAIMYEYGRSDGTFPKKPFVRKAFTNRNAIEKEMRKAQKEASGGILDE